MSVLETAVSKYPDEKQCLERWVGNTTWIYLPSSMVERLPKLFVKLSMLFVGEERPDSRVDEPRSDPESFCTAERG